MPEQHPDVPKDLIDGSIVGISARNDPETGCVRVTVEFDVSPDRVFGDSYGLALADSVNWVRRVVESSDAERMRGLEWEVDHLRTENQRLWGEKISPQIHG